MHNCFLLHNFLGKKAHFLCTHCAYLTHFVCAHIVLTLCSKKHFFHCAAILYTLFFQFAAENYTKYTTYANQGEIK